jgi:hypothetical protein
MKKQRKKAKFSLWLINQHVIKKYGVVEVYIHAFISLALATGEW